MSEAVIRLRALRFAWRGTVQAPAPPTLSIDHLDIASGSQVFLHGPSGCGKSTLLGLLAGVLLPNAGSVCLLGQDWSALPRSRRDAFRAAHIGYIFQQFNLLPYLSALDNVLLPCNFSPLRKQRAWQRSSGSNSRGIEAIGDIAQRARELLQRVGLSGALVERAASTLSVGQQQRVAAIRALIGQPELVLADEPTSALDAEVRDEFLDLLQAECRAAGSTLLFVSHDQRLAERFDRQIALTELNHAAGAPAS